MVPRKDKCYKLWAQRALDHRGSWKATSNDSVLARLEIDALRKKISKGKYVLDAGCGNGRVIGELVKTNKNQYVGYDYCREMIEVANRRNLRNCRFLVGNMLDFKEVGFDVVFTVRALINIRDVREQVKAVNNIIKNVKVGGKIILLEPTIQGIDRINSVRKIAKLKPITAPWHNLYLDETAVLKPLYRRCDVHVEHFASSYYLTSRLFYAYLCKRDKVEMEYESSLNLLSEQLPAIGDFAPHRMFVGTRIS